jgi:glyoxylase-like metal-dependent hydrolase (beta-lactamase superfamily II)
LHESLKDLGFSRNDITDVFLTHLHFDHCGGALEKDDSGSIVPAFPKAKYWSCKSHLEWALEPNARERASFLKENIVPLADHGVLEFIDEEQDHEWIDGIRVMFVHGHTEAMMIPKIRSGDNTFVFCADLLPSSFHVGMPYVMSYDIRPLVTMAEKSSFFQEATEHQYILFLEHDPVHECITLKTDERGRFTIDKSFHLKHAGS